MENRKWIFVGIISLVFVFAGYNLYSYFTEQQAIQIEEDRLAQERRGRGVGAGARVGAAAGMWHDCSGLHP